MTIEAGILAISIDLCPAICERQPSHVRRPSHTPYLPPQPAGDSSFGLEQPDWCARPSNKMKLEELSTNAVFDVGDKPFYIIGRNEKADIVLDSLYVSRRHAALLHHAHGGTYIMDLGSVHGTYLGNERTIPYVPTLIRKGVLLQFGCSTLRRQFLLKECPPMEQLIRHAQTHGSVAERDVMLNTQLNCFLSYHTGEEETALTRQALFRRNTLDEVPCVCSESSDSGCRARCHSETSDESSELDAHAPVRKRVRFYDDMDESTSSDDSRELAF